MRTRIVAFRTGETAAPHRFVSRRTTDFVFQPYINPSDQLSFEESFKTCSTGHDKTLAAMRIADSRRQAVKKCMADGNLSHVALSKALADYM